MTSDDLDGLVGRTAAAASAYINGDIHTYLSLIPHAGDYTLLPPYGGEPPPRGFDHSPEHLRAIAETFHGGEAELEVLASWASGDLAVLVVVERQRGRVFELPEQDWSLRVTLVFRREGGEWLLAHRHADPLVHRVRPEVFAALARGDA